MLRLLSRIFYKKHAKNHVKTAIWGGFSALKKIIKKMIVQMAEKRMQKVEFTVLVHYNISIVYLRKTNI